MDEIRYELEYKYDVNNHVEILIEVNKKNRKVSIVMLIASILVFLSAVAYCIRTSVEIGFGYVIFAVILLLFSMTFMKSSSRKQLLMILNNNAQALNQTFTYKYYDNYVNIIRESGVISSDTNIQYSYLKNATLIKEDLGYALLKDNSVVFIVGNQTRDIVEFLKTKLTS